MSRYATPATPQAAILIGGRSTRMGRPKHLLPVGGLSLYARTIEILRAVTDRIVVVGAGALPDDGPPLPRVPDAPETAGPLAGILAALRADPGRAALVVACDLPELSTAALAWLLAQRVAGAAAVLPHTRDGVPQPLPAIYEPGALVAIERMIAAGVTAPHRIGRFAQVAQPTIPDQLLPGWCSVNTPADLLRLTRGRE